MAQGGNGIVDNHTWPCPAHYLAYLIAHIWLITVYLAPLALRFLITKLAPIEPAMCIAFQCPILLRGGAHAESMTTIELNHTADNLFLTIYSVSHTSKILEQI